ncbi:MAG: winged helix-turn-helix domain-containing protein [bacterium]|nr:MAG: winged helix-turn-helix domain-containing protein [bacterium]
MAIPDYQMIMLPLLNYLSDGKEKSSTVTFEELADLFNLSEAERKELLPNGQQPIFSNRIAWAKAYLKKAGLIQSSRRGIYKITTIGKKVLKQKPDKIDSDYFLEE